MRATTRVVMQRVVIAVSAAWSVLRCVHINHAVATMPLHREP